MSTGLFELHMKTKSYSLEWNRPTKNKFALAVIGDKGSVVGHLIKAKVDDLREQFSIFYGQASIMGVEFMSQVKLSIKEKIKEWKFHVR